MTKEFKIPPIALKDRTPLVEQLIDIIQGQQEQLDILKEEIRRLKGHKGKPDIKPSSLTTKDKKARKKKNQTSAEKEESSNRSADRVEVIKVENKPEGSRFKGYRTFWVQELIIKKETILYQLERWQLPDGRYEVARLPDSLGGSHFGPVLRAYVLHQYHHQGVTQPLLLKQLQEWGIQLSSGQLNDLLIEKKSKFHEEKEEILRAGLSVSGYIHVDDTGARHQGQNGVCTHIGNELFAWFESTGSKSRINFLKLLRQGHKDYVLNDEAWAYMEKQSLAPSIREELKQGEDYFADEAAWKAYLEQAEIKQPRHIQIATEAALIGSILHHGFSLETVIMSDDAGQFNIFRHVLCWIHLERNVHKLIAEDEKRHQQVEIIRQGIWSLYEQLKAYKKAPSEWFKQQIEQAFDNLCQQKTDYRKLDMQLKKMQASRPELLLVLERPDLPLHNNLSERDIREYVKRRKINGSTRSDEGRRCRDTFASLKKTALKLKVGFYATIFLPVTSSFLI